MKKLFILMILPVMTIFFHGCKDDDDITNGSGTLNLNISNLTDLGPDAQYEGWLIIDGNTFSTGRFTVDGNGNLSKTQFSIDEERLKDASDFVLTIEPEPDDDSDPSDSHILAGSFSGNTANITIGNSKALGNDFTSASGKYLLATPTNGDNTNEGSGVWFLELMGTTQHEGLSLPDLPDGWKYEGWAIINGTPVTTGKFTNTDAADEAAPYSGTMQGPPFPGEDFLTNAPSGLTFPVDLSDQDIAITIEPEPDNSDAPFTALKPLKAKVSTAAADHTNFNLENDASSAPGGSATR